MGDIYTFTCYLNFAHTRIRPMEYHQVLLEGKFLISPDHKEKDQRGSPN